jgi:hypothetical protein
MLQHRTAPAVVLPPAVEPNAAETSSYSNSDGEVTSVTSCAKILGGCIGQASSGSMATPRPPTGVLILGLSHSRPADRIR